MRHLPIASHAPLLLAAAGACLLALAWMQSRLPQWLAVAVLLAVGAALALAWRRLAARRRQRTRAATAAGIGELFGRKAVVAAGDAMLKGCRRARRPLTVAVVELSDLPEVRSLFGSDVAGQITRRLAVRLQAIASNHGLAERTSATQFTVLLPGMEAATARNALRAIFGDGGCVEHECDGEELVLLPEVRVAQVPGEHKSIMETYAGICNGLAKPPATGQPPSAQACVPTVPVPL